MKPFSKQLEDHVAAMWFEKRARLILKRRERVKVFNKMADLLRILGIFDKMGTDTYMRLCQYEFVSLLLDKHYKDSL